MPKFLCVKGIIFFSFWQGFGISILVAMGLLQTSSVLDSAFRLFAMWLPLYLT